MRVRSASEHRGARLRAWAMSGHLEYPQCRSPHRDWRLRYWARARCHTTKGTDELPTSTDRSWVSPGPGTPAGAAGAAVRPAPTAGDQSAAVRRTLPPHRATQAGARTRATTPSIPAAVDIPRHCGHTGRVRRTGPFGGVRVPAWLAQRAVGGGCLVVSDARQEVLEEDAGHELLTAVDTDLLEDRLQMVLHGVRGDAQRAADLDCRPCA